MGSIYLGIAFVSFFLTIILFTIFKRTRINIYVSIVIYLALMLGYLFNAKKNMDEYFSYNEIEYSDVIKITINNKIIKSANTKLLFEVLKNDQFSFVNHPIKKKEYFVRVYTKKRIYNFRILDTHNQGVLVSRIDINGRDYVTNRNDNIIFFLSK